MSPERPPPPEEAHVVRQGYLRRLKTMKRKYFVLKSESRQNSARLEYYDSEKKFRSKAPPKRAIPLKSCFNINRRLDTKHKHVIALYTKEEGFCIVLEDEDELRAWLNALLALHHGEEGSDELLHPKQHVWTVNVQKKGLGASKSIIGLYNLCLTDKSVSLTKIKGNNNIVYDTCVPDHLEFSLRNVRRCGNSECFFYMEMGRQTVTGAGELWMLADDSNIASSMHTTILRAMKNCTKDNNDKDLQPAYRYRSMSANDACKPLSMYNRRQTVDGKTGLSPSNASMDESSNNIIVGREEGDEAAGVAERLKSGCHSRTASLPIGCALFAPPPAAAPRVAHARTRSLPLAGDEPNDAINKSAEHHNSQTVNGTDSQTRARQAAPAWSGRRASTGCRLAKWSPAHPKNGTAMVRNRCDSMPSRVYPRTDIESERGPSRVPSQYLEDVGEVVGSDEVDAAEWHCTPRIPEEPDQPYCEMNPPAPRRLAMKMNSAHHSRNSSLAEEASPPDGYLSMVPSSLGLRGAGDTGYVDMHAARASSPAASGSSIASGTPSTDIRFSEYHLDPASSKILLEDDERPIPRAYSVGSRPTANPHVRQQLTDTSRTRAFSVGSKSKMRPIGHPPPPTHTTTPTASNKTSSAPLLAPRSSAGMLCDDLMELDFSNNQSSPRTRPQPTAYPHVARTPPTGVGIVTSTPRSNPPKVDEYVTMSPSTPKTSAYMEMRPSERVLTLSTTEPTLARSPPANVTHTPIAPSTPATPDGYVEMNYSKRPDTNQIPSRPILILSDMHHPHGQSSSIRSSTDSERSTPQRPTPLLSPQAMGRNGPINTRNAKKVTERQRRNSKDSGTPISAQAIFSLSLDSPASPSRPLEPERELEVEVMFGDCSNYAEMVGTTLSTVRELNEEGGRKSQEVAGSPNDYIVLKPKAARSVSQPIAARGNAESSDCDGTLLSSNPTATKTLAREVETARPVEESRPALVRAASGPGARFTPIEKVVEATEAPSRKSSSPKPVESALNRALRGDAATPPPLNYALLDLVESHAGAPPSPTPSARTYTQIDFARSEKLNTIDTN